MRLPIVYPQSTLDGVVIRIQQSCELPTVASVGK